MAFVRVAIGIEVLARPLPLPPMEGTLVPVCVCVCVCVCIGKERYSFVSTLPSFLFSLPPSLPPSLLYIFPPPLPSLPRAVCIEEGALPMLHPFLELAQVPEEGREGGREGCDM